MQIQQITYNDLNQIARARKQRESQDLTDIDEKVQSIVDDIKLNGEPAVLNYIKELDGAEVDSIIVSDEEIQAALETVDPNFIKLLEEAKANIEKYHALQKENRGTTMKPQVFG